MRTLMRLSAMAAISAALLSSTAFAQGAAAPAAQAAPDAAAAAARRAAAQSQPLVPFEAVNPGEPWGDRLGPARRLAAAIVAQDNPNPKLIVDVGSFTGEFLEAFMEQFPNAHGQWTEPVDNNRVNAGRRLGKWGKNIDYVIGCASRDISLGCVPKGVDVMLTSWVSIHQNLEGIRKFYKEAYGMLPSGGWLVHLEHVAYGGSPWEARLKAARAATTKLNLTSNTEGPPVHHKEFVTPTLEDQMTAFKDAGFDDVQVVWRRFDTVLFMARKH